VIRVKWLGWLLETQSQAPDLFQEEKVRIVRPVEVHWIVQGLGIDPRSVDILQR